MNVFDAVVRHVKRLHAEHRRVVVAAWTPGARERLSTLLADHGLKDLPSVESYAEALALPGSSTALAVLGLEQGFETPELAVIGEQDILGDRLVRPRRKRSAVDVLTEATSLSVGDLVVHADHGIGRFAGLKTITVLGAPHDCLEISTRAATSCSCPSRISSCSRATAPTRRARSSTGSAASPGSRARRGSRSGCARSPPS